VSRLLTKDNRLFFDDSKRIVMLGAGQQPGDCKCCGGGTPGLCCAPYGPGLQRLLKCGLGLSPTKPTTQGTIQAVGFCTYTSTMPSNPGSWTSVINKSGPINFSGNKLSWCKYLGLGVVEQVVPNKNLFTVSLQFESYNVENPAILPQNTANTLCTLAEGATAKYVQFALIKWGAVMYKSNGSLAFDMAGDSNWTNWFLDQSGQTHTRSNCKLSPVQPGGTCASSITGGLGDGCLAVLNLHQSATFVYGPEKIEFAIDATLTIPWINECGTGEKSPPPTPSAVETSKSGCSNCGKKRHYETI
jgi:hypothetical protein